MKHWLLSSLVSKLYDLYNREPFFSLSPWKLKKIGKFRDSKKICGPIPFNFSLGLVAKYWSLRAKWGIKVRISRFPWQPIGIFKFCFRETDLWPGQIVCAKFRQDPSRNQGGDVNHPSPAHKITKKNSVLKCRIFGSISFSISCTPWNSDFIRIKQACKFRVHILILHVLGNTWNYTEFNCFYMEFGPRHIAITTETPAAPRL